MNLLEINLGAKTADKIFRKHLLKLSANVFFFFSNTIQDYTTSLTCS